MAGNTGVGAAAGVVTRLITELAVLVGAECATIFTAFFFNLSVPALAAGWIARLAGWTVRLEAGRGTVPLRASCEVHGFGGSRPGRLLYRDRSMATTVADGYQGSVEWSRKDRKGS